MLAPLPAIVQVLDETAALPTIPVLPTSRLAQPVGSADCARTKPALTASTTDQCHRGQSSAPNLSFLQNDSPGKLSRAARTWLASRQCWPKRTCTSSKSAQLLVVASQADSAGKSAAKLTLARKNSTFTEVQSSRARIENRPQWGRTRATTTRVDRGSGNNYGSMRSRYPSRIVCLTEESTELYLLLHRDSRGGGDRGNGSGLKAQAKSSRTLSQIFPEP